MKKILVTIFTFVALFSIPAQAVERSFGISFTHAGVDTTVTDDIDANGGTPDTTKNISNDVGIPSLFFEASNAGDRGVLTVGIDWIPLSAEWDARSTTQSSVKASGDGAASSGTNKGSVDVSGHMTLYIQPGIMLGDTGTQLFGTLGLVRADAEVEVVSVSSTNKTVDDTLEGTKVGIGFKRETGFGFMKLEYSETDYDPISVTTSNNTKVTGDMDIDAITLSLGKSF
jgi:hypothetical protein